MVREQRVRLDVERELRRRALDPEHRVRLARREVIGGVDLHDRELRGVELQPCLGRLGVGRVEVAVLDQRRIGPRRGADQDAGRPSRQPQAAPPSSLLAFLRRTLSFACTPVPWRSGAAAGPRRTRWPGSRARRRSTGSRGRAGRASRCRRRTTNPPTTVTAIRLPLRLMKSADRLERHDGRVVVPAAPDVGERGLDLLDDRGRVELLGVVTPDLSVSAARRGLWLGHRGLVSHDPWTSPNQPQPALLSHFPLWITCFRRAQSPRNPAS